MSSHLYEKAFKIHLEQDEMEIGINPGAEAAAMSDTLDPGTDASSLGAPEGAGGDVQSAMARNNQAMKDSLTHWINEMDGFVEFLNGLDDMSVQSQLKNSIPDTIMDKIRSSEMKKISRVSMEVAGLKEILRGYLASSDDSKYKFV